MKSQNKIITLIISLAIFNTIILIYSKYSINNLPLTSFDFSKTGNIFSLVLLLFVIINCFLLMLKKQETIIPHLRFIIVLLAFSISPIIIIIIFNLFELEFIKSYFLGYPLKKIIPITFFLFNQVTFLFILFFVWFLRKGNILFSYLYSIFSVSITICVLIIYSFTSTFFVEEFDISKSETTFDYGIILGAAVWSKNRPSPIFTGRIDKGADLYQAKVIEKIQLTGGNAPGELSEAKVAFNYLRDNFRISSSDLLIEEITSTTNEQIRFISNKFINKNKLDKFLFISDEFHLKRISEMAEFYNLDACVVSSGYKLNFQKSLYYRFRDSIGLILFWFFAV